MGLGILDDTHLEHVPGTALLAEIQATRHSPELDALPNVDTSGLKHNNLSGTLVLVPQPWVRLMTPITGLHSRRSFVLRMSLDAALWVLSDRC